MPSCISFTSLCPSSGDSEQVLLSKILQAINSGSGGLAGVSSISVDGGPPQTGAVSFTTSSGVTSVQGDPGPAVSLDTSEIPELTNLYFTEPRVLVTDLAGFAAALGAITAADTILTAFGKTQGRLAALEAGTSGPFLLKAGDTGTGAFLFTPSVVDVIPLTLTSAVGSATASSLFVANGGATNRLTIRNDGRFILAGRILATNTDVLGNTLNFSDAGTTNAPIGLAIGHTSTAGLGTAAAGFGIMLDFNLDSTTTLATRATRQTVAWTVAAHATRTASTTFFAFTGGAETTQLTLVNNQVQGGDGTVALPTFSNRNDPNSGTFFPAADTLAWGLGGVEAARLNSVGLGVGAAATVAKLQVLSAGVSALFGADPTTAGLGLYISGSTIGASYGYAGDDGEWSVNKVGFQNGLTAFRDFTIYDGKGDRMLFTDGSTHFMSVGLSFTPSANLDINQSTSPTKLYVYETTDGAASPANYSRSIIQTQAGNHLIRTEAGGTGTLRTLQVGTGPATGMNIAGVNTIFHGGQSTGSGAGGSILFQTSAAGGAGSGVNALATVVTIDSFGLTLGGSAYIVAGSTALIGWNSRSLLSSAVGDGIITLTNNGQSDFSRLQFGGITSSFPAIKRSTTFLQFRLADDSGYTGFTAGIGANAVVEVNGTGLGFFTAAPIARPTTGIAAATFVANTSDIADDTATFDGYTIGQVVKALRNIGILT